MTSFKNTKSTPRSVALAVLLKVIKQGRSLSQLKGDFQHLEDCRDRSLATEITNGVLRWRWKLDAILSPHLKKPLRNKDIDVHIILYIAVYELIELDIPDYATVNEAVALVKSIKKIWAKGLVNAVVRNVIRDSESHEQRLIDNDSARYSHPPWLMDLLKQDWPTQWQDIANANNQRPPIWLRVNQQQVSGAQYQEKMQALSMASSKHPELDEALKTESKINVIELPDFEAGAVSVQDAGAQFAAHVLQVKEGERVLDLCAAPGGKACHILELSPKLAALVAVDSVEDRMLRVKENLNRLKLEAQTNVVLITGDASKCDTWWDGELFDCILVDAPCSATGVIRRHPDIKSLRREDDLEPLVALQQEILAQAWTMLAAGGRLLYVTCSVLRQENELQIKQFLMTHEDAVEKDLAVNVGISCENGRQLLPGEMDMDGFYYAYMSKQD